MEREKRMEHRCCANCVYSSGSTHRKFSGFLTGFGVRLTCSNHPDSGGRLREVRPGGLCRHYRPKPADQPTGAIRRLTLANGQSVLVDAADYDWLSRYHWTMRRRLRHPARERQKYLHASRDHAAPPGKLVDHYDGCRQNNYRENLRLCTRQGEPCAIGPGISIPAPSSKGSSSTSSAASGLRRIFCEGEYFRSPLFADEADAARAYDRFAVELFGAFAYVNFPEDWPPARRAEVYAQKETVQAIRKRRAERAKKAKTKGKKAKGESKKAKGKGTSKKAKGKSRKQEAPGERRLGTPLPRTAAS